MAMWLMRSSAAAPSFTISTVPMGNCLSRDRPLAGGRLAHCPEKKLNENGLKKAGKQKRLQGSSSGKGGRHTETEKNDFVLPFFLSLALSLSLLLSLSLSLFFFLSYISTYLF
jgi:hypothetical protein